MCVYTVVAKMIRTLVFSPAKKSIYSIYIHHCACHESDLCGSLRWPPEGTLTGVLTPSRTSFPITPSAADYLPRCGSSPGLFNQCPQSHSLRSLVLAPADISERLPILLIVTSVFDPGLPYLGTLNLCL